MTVGPGVWLTQNSTYEGIEPGLKLFEEITYLDEYYLTNAEIEALERHATEIAKRLPEGSRLVELGSG
jgi:L-histidine Nalpha-methyltransferase / hercynylcysteine S-oxide synthase